MHNAIKQFLTTLLIVGLLVVNPSQKTVISKDNLTEFHVKEINVALYNGGIINADFFKIFHYEWKINSTIYRFNVTVLNEEDIRGKTKTKLTNENFDVLLISGAARTYLQNGFNLKWRKGIQDFIANGGGYIGICGGAIAASMGYEKPRNAYYRYVNQGVLRLANIYVDDDLDGEWQYALKHEFNVSFLNVESIPYPSAIDLNTTVEKNPDNVVFSVYDKGYRHIKYGGGPGMYNASFEDPKLGQVIPLLTYNEEPMITKPIHYWILTPHGFKIWKNVTTSLKGTYAGIATTYNNSGRIVLFGPHPEDTFTTLNGTIKEYLGHGFPLHRGPKKYAFSYYGELNFAYNWWIIRRAVAWCARLPNDQLPPVDNKFVSILRPYSYGLQTNHRVELPWTLYNKFNKPIVVGNSTITAVVSNNTGFGYVEFYLDGKLVAIDDQPEASCYNIDVYRVKIKDRLFGVHNIKVKSYDSENQVYWDELDVLFL